jgi:hypothetical protein
MKQTWRWQSWAVAAAMYACIGCIATQTRIPTEIERNASFELYPTYERPEIQLSVYDARAKEPLIGIRVRFVTDSSYGITDVDGRAKIPCPSPGVYDLRIEVAGYQTLTLRHVTVSDGFLTNIGGVLLNPLFKLAPVKVW